ncbi:uncharacterized protein B0T15DRAFT_251800 [Chaetomium strumarium]|uniref:MYND-type domain-containing protein n=1 Tax=Chaetomium strumarium TaxID=1170767 RepID=A0AAJ0M0U4_9PEZI|nr:hypothetical protein B0T15DRAFT_251800 [Chaetomium strumarium]
MLTPAIANLLAHFYPIGNTPAVCLTQNLPPEKQADILLLGCGDVRSILFTAHSDGRPMDITCCDAERAILARNILLLSLIIDDPAGQKDDDNWDIYYHLHLCPASFERLQAQAKKLHGLASSMETWRRGEYGKHIKFCDRGTLTRVAEIWRSYFFNSGETARRRLEESFKAAIEKSRKMKDDVGAKFSLSCLRSAAPTLGDAAELNDLHQFFWKNGITDMDATAVSRTTHPNPMFVSPDAAVTLHYGTDPLLGFHISIAYAPLSAKSPLFQPASGTSSVKNPVKAARAEWSMWSKSFRAALSGLTIRFFAGDAIALSHTLQCRRATGDAKSACWYRHRQDMDPLILDEDDYGPEGSAPLLFTVIDTSNLSDHLGALNVLTATSPLLSGGPAATLYTEVLVKQGKSLQDLVDDMLCGHLSTMALLLGLFPLDYWTNASPASAGQEALLDFVARGGKPDFGIGQSFVRIAWKRPFAQGGTTSSSPLLLQALRLDEGTLAEVLYRVYQRMFSGEDLSHLFSIAGNIATLRKFSLPQYTRVGFVSFLRLVKSRVLVDWGKTMNVLLASIENDRSLLMGMNYIQELYLYMHLLDVHTVDILKRRYNTGGSSSLHVGNLLDWADIPPVVSVTLKVPRAKLALFTDGKIKSTSTPPLHCLVQSPPASKSGAWQNIFAAVQIGFGQLSTSGSRQGGDFKLHLTDDPLGWQGESPLFASFKCPTWVLLLEPQTAMVAFGIQSTPATASQFLGRLGVDMNVFGTTLGDAEHVYFSKDLPNQTGRMSVCGFAEADMVSPGLSKTGAETSIVASICSATGKVSSLTGRIDFISGDLKSALQGGCQVQTTPSSPCEFAISVGKAPPLKLRFPVPLMPSKCKTRVARKSSYIEVVVPAVTSPSQTPSEALTYPVLLDSDGLPTACNMPYLNLERLPIIDTTQHPNLRRWMTPHVSGMLSARERRLRDDPSLPRSAAEQTRLDFKDSLFSLLMHYTGLQGGRKAHIFGLSNPSNGGVHILLFVSALRLDLANRTVVLDVAALPLYDALMPRIAGALGALRKQGVVVVQVKVDDAELRLWKYVLPACVERCRTTWAHRGGGGGCEYYAGVGGPRAPPLEVENGRPLLCTCGNGVFPDGFLGEGGPNGVPQWRSVAKYAVRAALSPAFFCPLVDELDSFLDEMRDKIDPFKKEEQEEEEEEEGSGSQTQKGGCRVCGADKAKDGGGGVSGGALRACARCRKVKYCSRECQRADWKAHKGQCVEET